CADEDGWLHTGDLGRIDEEGFLYVEDRLGDVIVTGGENVLPAEVEEVLLRHPAVVDAAAVGRADAEWQEAVEAVVVLRDGAYDASYAPVAIDGDVAVATGTSTYFTEPGGSVDKVYDNCFVMRFDDDGRCREFIEWFIKRPHT